jgi:hypothetical protein
LEESIVLIFYPEDTGSKEVPAKCFYPCTKTTEDHIPEDSNTAFHNIYIIVQHPVALANHIIQRAVLEVQLFVMFVDGAPLVYEHDKKLHLQDCPFELYDATFLLLVECLWLSL